MTRFDPADWPRLSRPEGGPATVAVHRVRDPRPVPPDAIGTGDGPQLLSCRDGRAIVRFRHHAPQATAVALAASGWWRPGDPAGCDLAPAGNGWWSGCFVVPTDWQVSYRFVEADASGDPPWWRRGLRDPGGRAVPDATHPRRHRASRGTTSSILRLPGADRPWLAETADPVPPPRALPLDGDAPRTWWWAPESADPLPLLIFTDGEKHVEPLGTYRMLHRAIVTGALPPLAAVFVAAGADRAETLGVPDGHAAWIADTLVPTVRARGLDGRPVTDAASRTIITGSSFGGLTALFALARAPQVIGAAVAQSPSLWRYPQGSFAPVLRGAAATAPIRLRLQAGRYEGAMLPMAQALCESLAVEGIDAECEPRTGGHDWAWWVPAAIDAGIALLQPGGLGEGPGVGLGVGPEPGPGGRLTS